MKSQALAFMHRKPKPEPPLPFPDLPWELKLLIFEFASTPTLNSVVRTCKGARDFGERLLYRHIDLWCYQERSACFLQTVRNRPELLQYVITYRLNRIYVKAREGWRKWFWCRLQGQKYVDRTGAYSLDAASRLQNARTIMHNWEQPVLQHSFESRPIWPALENFRLNSSCMAMVDYGSMLSNMPAIKRLDISSIIHEFLDEIVETIHSHHAPPLEELTCTTEAASALVPGRPIWKLVVFNTARSGPSLVDLMPQIAQSARIVRVLGLAIHSLQAPGVQEGIQDIPKFLPELEELHLFLLTGGAQSDEGIVHGILGTVSDSSNAYTSNSVDASSP